MKLLRIRALCIGTRDLNREKSTDRDEETNGASSTSIISSRIRNGWRGLNSSGILDYDVRT